MEWCDVCMYCPNCGTKQVEGATICPNCQTVIVQTTMAPVVNPVNNGKNSSSSFGWGVLGFFIPIVGVCLYALWQNERPDDSKAAGIGALIGFVSSILLSILIFILYFVLIFMIM